MPTRKKSAAPDVTADADIERMFRHPGFLIRRAQQVAVSSFIDHYGHHGITPTQSALLKIVQHSPGVDQVGAGRMLGLDRTTAATSVATLAAEKLLERRNDPNDGRRRTLFITSKGEKLLAKIGDMRESGETMLSVFSADEARTFLRLLDHFVTSSNANVRIPMEPVPAGRRTRAVAARKKNATG